MLNDPKVKGGDSTFIVQHKVQLPVLSHMEQVPSIIIQRLT
jgi:hypothetical protein